MATEIPIDLVNQLQILLRKEANLSFYDPGDATLPSLPSVAEAITELDPSPPYLRCKHCKGKLLRGIESLICVFCGRQQRTTDNPPGPIKFTSTSGYRWLLSSLHLDGSERVETTKEADGLNRGRNTPVEEIPLSSLLDFEIQWRADEEKLTSSSSSGKSTQGKVALNLGGVDLGSFFADGRGTAPEDQPAHNKPMENPLNTDFKDPRSLSLFDNVESKGSSMLQQDENLRFLEKRNGQERFSSPEQGNLSLFLGNDAQESISTTENKDLSLFEKNDVQEIVSTNEQKNVSLFEGNGAQDSVSSSHSLFGSAQPSEAAADSVEDKICDFSSNWDVDFQSAGEQTLSQEPKSVHPFVDASIDLSAHVNSFHGSGTDGKPNDYVASQSNEGNWFQEDLFTKTQQEQQNDTTVHNKDAEKKEDSNGSFSTNIDWIQDNLWQTSTNKASDKKTPDFDDDDWNDFASSTNVKTPSDSFFSQSGLEAFDGTTDNKNGGRIESGESPSPTMNWTQYEKWQIGTSSEPVKSENQEDDLLDAWNGFTGSNVSQVPSVSSAQPSADHLKPSVKQTTELNLYGAPNDQQGFDFGGLSETDLFAGDFSNQTNSVEVKVAQSEASNSDRTGKPDGKIEDTTQTNDLFDATTMSKTDEIDLLMSEMHDLSFMLENKLYVPSNPKAEEFRSFTTE